MRKLLEAFSRIWKPLIVLVGIALIIAFAVSWIVSIIGLFYSIPFLEYLNPGSELFSIVAPINLLFIIGIPLIGLGLFVARLAFGARVHANWRAGMLAFWIVNFISLCFWGSMIARDFSAGSEVSDRFYLQELSGDTLSLSQAGDQYEYAWYSFGDGLKFTGQELVSRDVFISLQKSDTGQFEIVRQVSSRGGSVTAANDLARAARYQLVQEGDRLIVSPAVVFPKGTKWRGQRVELKLGVPEGKFIRLDQNLARRINRMDLADGQERVYADNTLWRMEAGGLTCLNCPPREDEKTFDLGDFSGIKVDGAIEVDIERDERYGQDQLVSLQGKEHFLEEIDVVVAGQTLTVTTDKNDFTSPVYLRIKTPSLQSLSLENTGDVKIVGLKEQRLELTVKGENELKAVVDLDSLILRQEGRNQLDLRGRVGWLDASLNDHARLDAEKAEIKSVVLNVKQYGAARLPKIDNLKSEAEENSKVVVDGREEERRME